MDTLKRVYNARKMFDQLGKGKMNGHLKENVKGYRARDVNFLQQRFH